jgi:UDP-2,3-diacylglucosamine hydrolase
MRAYFLSDLHLKKPEESNSQKLLLFLLQLEHDPQVSQLFLVGDIFDLWVSEHNYFVDKFIKIVNAIKVLVGKGIEVHYFEGNHDLYLKKFWQQEVGVKVHEGPESFLVQQYKIRVEHGDFMNPDDKAYLRLRWFLRTAPMRLIAHNLPGELVAKIGDRMSQVSRTYTAGNQALDVERIKEFMHRYAEKVAEQESPDYLISGHTHVRDIYHVSEGGTQTWAINLGSWFDDQLVLRIDGSGHQFLPVEDISKEF